MLEDPAGLCGRRLEEVDQVKVKSSLACGVAGGKTYFRQWNPPLYASDVHLDVKESQTVRHRRQLDRPHP